MRQPVPALRRMPYFAPWPSLPEPVSDANEIVSLIGSGGMGEVYRARFVRTLRPLDAAGVEGVFPMLYAGASDSYVFGYKLLLTSLFTVSGLQ